jgi:hypothetical protein
LYKTYGSVIAPFQGVGVNNYIFSFAGNYKKLVPIALKRCYKNFCTMEILGMGKVEENAHLFHHRLPKFTQIIRLFIEPLFKFTLIPRVFLHYFSTFRVVFYQPNHKGSTSIFWLNISFRRNCHCFPASESCKIAIPVLTGSSISEGFVENFKIK